MSWALSDKQLEDLRNIHNIQGDYGNWDYDPYMHGMYNGMEIMLATVEDRDPVFKQAPDNWIHDYSPGALPSEVASESDQVDALGSEVKDGK